MNEKSANDLLTKIELSRNMYLNGNYIVISPSYNNFTIKKRALRINEELKADFPDSIDLKISNRCSIGCKYCHENSIPTGDIFDFDKWMAFLDFVVVLALFELFDFVDNGEFLGVFDFVDNFEFLVVEILVFLG